MVYKHLRLSKLLAALPGVTGVCIVRADGQPLANQLPAEYDPETVGLLSLGIYSSTTKAVRRLAHNKVQQVVARTQQGSFAIIEDEEEYLIIISEQRETAELANLMRSVTILLQG